MFSVNNNSNFKSESFSPKRSSNSDDDFSIRMSNNNKSFKNEKFNTNMKPMFSNSSSGNIRIPENKRLNIKPKFFSSNSSVKSDSSSSKVPLDSFSAFSNPKSSINGSQSSYEDEDDDDSDDGIMNRRSSNDDDDDDESVPMSRSGSSYVSGSGSGSEYSSSYDSDSDEEDSDEEDSDDEDEDSDDEDSDDGSVKKVKEMTYEEIAREKQNLLFELERLQKSGFTPSKRYSMASTYDEMKFERDRLKRMRDVERSVKFSRKMLLGFVGGVEYLNNQFNPADLKLNGWSENMMENINDYDEVFEELHDKYSDSVKMPAELKLVMMVAGSGFMFHMTNSFLKSATPDLRDILKNNPDIMANINAAASKDMGQKIDQTYGRHNPVAGMMKGGLDMKQKQMNGPPNIDDLLGGGGDDGSVGNIKSFGSRTMPKKKGIVLNL
jgi:hypothetical protein